MLNWPCTRYGFASLCSNSRCLVPLLQSRADLKDTLDKLLAILVLEERLSTLRSVGRFPTVVVEVADLGSSSAVKSDGG